MGERNIEEGLYFVAAEPLGGYKELEDRRGYRYLRRFAEAGAHEGADRGFGIALAVEGEEHPRLSGEHSYDLVVALWPAEPLGSLVPEDHLASGVGHCGVVLVGLHEWGVGRAASVLAGLLASVVGLSKAVRLAGLLASAVGLSKAVRLVGRLSFVVAAGDLGEALCSRKVVGLVGVLDRGRHEHHEHLERHACPEAVFDRSPSVFAVAEAHVDRILAEGIDRAHSHDRGTSAATGRASPLAPTDCPDSLAPACFV